MNQNRSPSAAPPPIASEHVMRAGTSPMGASLATPRARLIAPVSSHFKPEHRGVRRALNGSKFNQSVAVASVTTELSTKTSP
jgi:hypothetical protein